MPWIDTAYCPRCRCPQSGWSLCGACASEEHRQRERLERPLPFPVVAVEPFSVPELPRRGLLSEPYALEPWNKRRY